MVVGGFAACKCGFCEFFAFFEDFEDYREIFLDIVEELCIFAICLSLFMVE